MKLSTGLLGQAELGAWAASRLWAESRGRCQPVQEQPGRGQGRLSGVLPSKRCSGSLSPVPQPRAIHQQRRFRAACAWE